MSGPFTKLDFQQVLKQVFDETNSVLRVENVASSVIGAVTIKDGVGATQATVKAASTAATATDTSVVVAINPNTAINLPTGASTSALQTTGNTSLASIDSKLTSPLSTVEQGYTVSQFVRNDYSSVNVTTAAYVQLIASTSNAYQELQIFDSSGQTLKIATGAPASEIDFAIIPPGGTFPFKFKIPAATRISIKSISGTANVGEIDLQLLG